MVRSARFIIPSKEDHRPKALSKLNKSDYLYQIQDSYGKQNEL